MSRETRKAVRCDVCTTSLRPGFLWLRGSDYVECPGCTYKGKQCGAKPGEIELITRECPPTGKMFIPGYRGGVTINKEWTKAF